MLNELLNREVPLLQDMLSKSPPNLENLRLTCIEFCNIPYDKVCKMSRFEINTTIGHSLFILRKQLKML